MQKIILYIEVAIEVCCFFIVLATADENAIAATTGVITVLGGLVIMLSLDADDKLSFLIKSNALITVALIIIAFINF